MYVLGTVNIFNPNSLSKEEISNKECSILNNYNKTNRRAPLENRNRLQLSQLEGYQIVFKFEHRETDFHTMLDSTLG